MSLDTNQLDIANKWLENNNRCYACGHHDSPLRVVDVVAFHTFVQGDSIIGDSTEPMLQLLCTHCGHVLFYDAAHIGLQVPR